MVGGQEQSAPLHLGLQWGAWGFGPEPGWQQPSPLPPKGPGGDSSVSIVCSFVQRVLIGFLPRARPRARGHGDGQEDPVLAEGLRGMGVGRQTPKQTAGLRNG